MTQTLTIFIDGLPFDQLEKLPYTSQLASQGRLVPILGYSVNCQTQLFTGKKPDALGFWCEWTYAPETAPFRKLGPLLKLLSVVEFSYYAKRVVHRFLDRLRWASATKNIPLAQLGKFQETGHSVLTDWFEQESLLDHPRLHTILHNTFPVIERRDEDAFKATKQYIEQTEDLDCVMVTFTRIDACSHWEGVASKVYDELLVVQDGYIRELSEAFLARVPDGVILIASDHGMTNVTDTVKLDLEGQVGSPTRLGYAYFSEGTILRVWCDDAAVRERIVGYLETVDGVEGLSDVDRKEFGITNPAFGDLIYHVHEGHQFVPSYWGPKPSVGMHGYHPRYPSQHGICLSSRAGDFDGEVSATDFYNVMSGYLGAA